MNTQPQLSTSTPAAPEERQTPELELVALASAACDQTTVEARLRAASDILDRLLQSEFSETYYDLVAVDEGNLMAFNQYLYARFSDLRKRFGKLHDELIWAFPQSLLCEPPPYLKEKGALSISDQIEMFRHETYRVSIDSRTRPAKRPSLQRSEDLIRKVLELYQDIERLRCEIDHCRKEGTPSGRHQAPCWTSYPYQYPRNGAA